jgi:hypothetical protein
MGNDELLMRPKVRKIIVVCMTAVNFVGWGNSHPQRMTHYQKYVPHYEKYVVQCHLYLIQPHILEGWLIGF